jgi:hypothetical protein
MSALRLYAPDEIRKDGYPAEWHASIKHAVRADAGHRCIRCGHPYRNGEHGNGEWTPCDSHCAHGMPARDLNHPFLGLSGKTTTGGLIREALAQGYGRTIEAHWRILTVHHLDGNKANCRWWNLASLCQRCHLTVQGRVRMERVWPWEHTDWFKPYVAGFYAFSYLGEDLTREQVDSRLDELLDLERAA